ncbi:MAG: acetolactate synthase large subunit, partial [bacterium]|nr:acetolactate synthase large subunit [Candidatus Colisoma equi]
MGKKGMRCGAEALVEALERAGAEVVFGYPGANVVDVFDRIRTAKFRFVLGRHEQGCTHMADGYARATGRPGVVVVTSGPGATNAITGLATANMDGVPMVLISGQVPLSQIGTDAFQEADMTGICRAATKHSFLVKSADEISETVAQAFYIATHGKPGAVVIDIPKNVQEEFTAAQYPERISLRAYHPEHAATTAQVNRLAKYLNEAMRPVIYAGGGVIAANAAKDVAALAKRAGIPVATTLMGIGSFDENDPLSLGMAGLHGTPAANTALKSADVIIALGVRFNDRVTGRNISQYVPRAKIVHVDCDPSSIDKNVTVDLGIVADIKDLLTTVNSRVKPNARAAGRKQSAKWKRQGAARTPVA